MYFVVSAADKDLIPSVFYLFSSLLWPLQSKWPSLVSSAIIHVHPQFVFIHPCQWCWPITKDKLTLTFPVGLQKLTRTTYMCSLLPCRDLPSDRCPTPPMTGSVHQTLFPTCVQLSIASPRMKRSWKNDFDTWGRRRRTGTTSSGANRILPSARFANLFSH